MNEALKVLYDFNKMSLKALNQTFHFDYNKPFHAHVVYGNTTIKQILKKVENKNSLIAVITMNPDSCFKDRYFVATIDKFEHVSTGPSSYSHYQFEYKSGLDYYSRIGSFRNAIKSPNSTTIVIAQEYQYLIKPVKHETDYSKRYKIFTGNRSIQKSCGYIDEISLVDSDTGRQFKYHAINWNEFKTDDISDIIDKSGYIVEQYRNTLHHKARELKAQRDKDRFIATDKSQQVADLKIRITAKKLELIERLKAAETYEELTNVGKAIGEYSWHGLAQVIYHFERMEKGIADNTYKSIEEFNSHYQKISDDLMAI